MELRAATSLARLWQAQSKRQEAYKLLAPVYGWSTEGFDTADLQDTKSLLAVAQQLISHGHHVRILAGPGLQPDRLQRPASAAFLNAIRAIGATLFPLQQNHGPFANIPPAQGLLWGWTPQTFAINVFLACRFWASSVWSNNVKDELTHHPSDVVVADFYLLGALAAAEAVGVPSAALVHHHHIRPTPGLLDFSCVETQLVFW